MKLQIRFYPDVDIKDLDSGVTAEISWQRLSKYLDEVFAIRDGERLVGITVNEAGIKAKIEYKKLK